MSPPAIDRTFAQVQARAFNVHDVEGLAAQAFGGARVIRDGRWVGEGRDALRAAFEKEATDDCVVRVADLDGEPVLVEYDTRARAARGVIRFDALGGRVREVRIDHDAATLSRWR